MRCQRVEVKVWRGEGVEEEEEEEDDEVEEDEVEEDEVEENEVEGEASGMDERGWAVSPGISKEKMFSVGDCENWDVGMEMYAGNERRWNAANNASSSEEEDSPESSPSWANESWSLGAKELGLGCFERYSRCILSEKPAQYSDLRAGCSGPVGLRRC